jgi:hypothetical protein
MTDLSINLPFLCLAATDTDNLRRLQLPPPPTVHDSDRKKSARDTAKDSFERSCQTHKSQNKLNKFLPSELLCCKDSGDELPRNQ